MLAPNPLQIYLVLKKEYLEFHSQAPNGIKLNLYWLPSHIGITGNEVADLLAKEATSLAFNDSLLIPFSDYSHNFKLALRTENNAIIKPLLTALAECFLKEN